MCLSQTPRIQTTYVKPAWRQERNPCDTGCMNTGHLLLASPLCWLLHKTPRKPKKHTVLRLHSFFPPLLHPTLAGLHIFPQIQQMSDHDNFIFSRYSVRLKHAFCLMITTDNHFIFRNFNSKARACSVLFYQHQMQIFKLSKRTKMQSMLTAKICKGKWLQSNTN